MKKLILIFTTAIFSGIIILGITSEKPITTSISFITLDIWYQDLPIQKEDGSWEGNVKAYYGITGNTYSKNSGGHNWTGFVQYADIKFKTGITYDTRVIQQVAQDSVTAYRNRVYHNIN